MGGIYDLLETYRIQNDPRFAYEGLYQDPMKPTNVLDPNYNSFTYNPDSPSYGYSTMYADNLQPFMSSSFPQEYGVGSLFNPRVGRPEQSIYYKEPEPADPTSDFYQPIGDPFQTDYPITRTIQEDEDEDQMIQEITAPYTGVTGIGYQTPRTIADQNRVLGQTFTEPKKSNGIMDAIMSFVIPGYNFIKNLGSGQPYERYTPGGTIRDGIYSIGGVNVPVSSFGGDFYNPNTGLNRFDRAAQRFAKTGSMADLFASSRTGKEFFEKRREIQAQKQKALEKAAKAKRQFNQDTGGGDGGFSGPGMAFAPKKDTFSGGKTKTTGGVPGGKYGSPK